MSVGQCKLERSVQKEQAIMHTTLLIDRLILMKCINFAKEIMA